MSVQAFSTRESRTRHLRPPADSEKIGTGVSPQRNVSFRPRGNPEGQPTGERKGIQVPLHWQITRGAAGGHAKKLRRKKV